MARGHSCLRCEQGEQLLEKLKLEKILRLVQDDLIAYIHLQRIERISHTLSELIETETKQLMDIISLERLKRETIISNLYY